MKLAIETKQKNRYKPQQQKGHQMGRKSKGKRIHSEGYVVISGGKHGQYEHRIVAEKKIGQKLKQGEIVHHKDRNKKNNKPGNLKVLTPSQHNKLHLSKKIKTRCGYCKNPLIVHPYKFQYSKSGKVFCTTRCSGKYNNGGGVKGKPFTKKEDKTIIKLRKKNLAWNRIGKILDRNRESIRVRGMRLMKGGK